MFQNDSIVVNADEYKATCSEVDLPLRGTRNIYYSIANWCIAISAGTLIYSIVNFDKFIITASDGVTKYIPYKEWYILFILFEFASTIIFIGLRAYVYWCDYYDKRLREIQDIDERLLRPNSTESKNPVSPAEKEFIQCLYDEYHKGYDSERADRSRWGKTEWTPTLRLKSMERAIDDFGGKSLNILKTPINRFLIAGTICYLAGLIISIVYVALFLWFFYDP